MNELEQQQIAQARANLGLGRINPNIGPDGLPLDWAEDNGYRGVSRAPAARCYAIRLSVLSTQRFIGNSSSQREAAFLYDLALWKLAAFQTRRLQPNFPNKFGAIVQSDVDNLCPKLNDLYTEAAKSVDVSNDTERELREKRLAANEVKAIAPGNVATHFTKYQKAVTKARVFLVQSIASLSVLRTRLNFSKLPEVAALATHYERKLEEADAAGRQLRALLESHAGYYARLNADGDIAI